MSIVKKFYPCTKDNKRALLLLDLLCDSSIYGAHRVAAMPEKHFAFRKERFKVWKILQGLDMDGHAGNFETV